MAKITIDGQTPYYVDEEQLVSYVREQVNSVLGKKIVIPNGPTIDLSSHGLIATGLRQLFVMFIPLLTWTASRLGFELPKKQRHEDVIRYVTEAYFEICRVSIQDMEFKLSSSPYVDDYRIIDNCDIVKEEPEPSLLNSYEAGYGRDDLP
jgi:hypothetical protein